MAQPKSKPQAANNKTAKKTAKNEGALEGLLPQDPDKALQQVMETVEAFKHVLMRETSALKATDTEGFLALQDEKLDVARAYQSGMSQLLSRKDEIRLASPALKERLANMQQDFRAQAQANRDSIERMRKGMERLEHRIMGAARKSAQKETEIVYGASGQMQHSGIASMGVNESV